MLVALSFWLKSLILRSPTASFMFNKLLVGSLENKDFISKILPLWYRGAKNATPLES